MRQSNEAGEPSLAGGQSNYIFAAARRRGLDCAFIDVPDEQASEARWLRVSVADRVFLFARGMILDTARKGANPLGRHLNEAALLLLSHKHNTKAFLGGRGFATPYGQMFHRRDLAAARAAFDAFDGPICVKPDAGKGGSDTFVDIRDRARYEAALDQVAARNQRIVVEQHIAAQPIRFFYIRPCIVGAKFGRPASVVGDGLSTIAELAAARNRERQLRALPSHLPIPTDAHTEDYLRAQGLNLSSVPAPSQRVFLRGTSNGSTGADAIICTEQVHPSYLALMAEACRAVPGLHITAVDALVADISQPAGPENHWILELNGSPGYAPFCFPWEGEPIDVAGMILDYLATDYRADAD